MVHANPDDLIKPLGVDRPARRVTVRRVPLGRIAVAALVVGLAGVSTYIVLVDDPLGGEPHSISPIVRRDAPPPPDGKMTGARSSRSTAAELEGEAGVAVIRPEGGSAPAAVIIHVPDADGGSLAPAPDRRLVERTRYGLLPKVGADGARPAQVYARPVGILPSGNPAVGRVVVVVGGLGISQSVTADAIAKLPRAVTLAFAPYGQDLDGLVGRAREGGHEVMLQVPMQPFDYPDNDPGPHTLTVEAKAADNLDRLHWVMGRFAGYVGVVNFMGGKLTANEAALAPILKEVGGRGLVFLDDGTSSRSLAVKAAQDKVPAVRADIALDGLARAEAIDKELARLESLARERGLAVATASALPVVLDRIVRWAKTLEGKGILMVPASAAYGGRG